MTIKTNSSLPFDVTSMMMLAVAGLIAKLFLSGGTSKDGHTGPASVAVWGYGLTSMSFIGLLLVVFGLSTRVSLEKSAWDAIKSIITSSFPVVATLLVLGWLVIINMTYMTRINQGKVAPEYRQFSFFSTVLLFMQIAVVFKYILETMEIDIMPHMHPTLKLMDKAVSSELNSITMVLTLLNLIFAGMMQVVVQFFSTDG